MAKSLISWALVGVLTYAWYWVGYVWPYLSGAHVAVWILFAILVILIHRRGGVADVGANVVETIIDRVKTIVGSMVGLIVVILVGSTLNMIVNTGGVTVDGYIQSVVLIVTSALTTSLFLGALDDATQ